MSKIATVLVLAASSAFLAFPIGAQAACTVPVMLSNGTTADANQVMQNFSSLAACAMPSTNPTFAGTVLGPDGSTWNSSGIHMAASLGYTQDNTLAFRAANSEISLNGNSAGNLTLQGDGGGRNSILINNGSAATAMQFWAGPLRMVLLANGNFGVGTATPVGPFDVEAPGNPNPILFNNDAAEGNPIIQVGSYAQGPETLYIYAASRTGANSSATALVVNANNSTGRSINASGTINASGADYAEYFYQDHPGTLSAGALTSLNRLTGKAELARPGHPLIGIVSTQPGFVGNDLYDKHHPDGTALVGLTGQVPTIVSDEGGAITIGDRISASSVPGIAKKASPDDETIGIAMTGWEKAGRGKIVVFIQHDMGSSKTELAALREEIAKIRKSQTLAASFELMALKRDNERQGADIMRLRQRISTLELHDRVQTARK